MTRFLKESGIAKIAHHPRTLPEYPASTTGIGYDGRGGGAGGFHFQTNLGGNAQTGSYFSDTYNGPAQRSLAAADQRTGNLLTANANAALQVAGVPFRTAAPDHLQRLAGAAATTIAAQTTPTFHAANTAVHGAMLMATGAGAAAAPTAANTSVNSTATSSPPPLQSNQTATAVGILKARVNGTLNVIAHATHIELAERNSKRALVRFVERQVRQRTLNQSHVDHQSTINIINASVFAETDVEAFNDIATGFSPPFAINSPTRTRQGLTNEDAALSPERWTQTEN